ncbi:C-X-C chemokine receptor type 4a [Salminus brasiliensis]|uniref:C-X-C chemokine receptor type 4a n=1 Tax=Salminus brasiliensis TaxID=930266 RepID=UPI003B82EBF4
MSYYEHIVFDDSFFLDNSSEAESGSGDLGADFDVPCDRALSHELQARVLPAVYGLIFALGLVGNGLVLLVMGCQKGARSMTDRYRLHLSVADLLFVLSLPFWAVDAARGWRFGGFMCVAVHAVYTVNLYGSVLLLAFISVDRYLAVARATSSRSARRLLAERVVYVGAWLPAALLTAPDLAFATVEEDLSVVEGEEARVVCARVYPPESAAAWSVAFRLQHVLVGFALPGAVLLACYCVVAARLARGPATVGAQKRRALRTTVALVACFFACWMPYCAAILVDALVSLGVLAHTCERQRALERWICATEALAYFHCCLNPILYAFLGATFKRSARNALTGGRSSSIKILPKKKGGVSTSTESESSSFHSS